MDLSIIIVNWNSKDYLKQCVASILAATHGIELEIVVIDNASYDGSGEILRQSYPQVRFIQSDTNLGFAKANNAAFHKSLGRNVLFLNPDTKILGPAVNIMLGYLQQLPNAGAIGCKLLNADKTIQTSCVQSFPTILNQILDSELLRALLLKSSLWGNAPLFGGQNGPEEVEAISGACMIMKRSVFEQVGLFSEEYFMYAEDIDLCYKIKQAGHKNYYIPDTNVIHFGGGSTEKRPSEFSNVIMCESIWRFLRKTRGKNYSLYYQISTLIAAVGRMAILIIILPIYIIRLGRKSWNTSFRKWVAILAWSLGLGGSVEPPGNREGVNL
jgi:GT2 family glycosyltransferase